MSFCEFAQLAISFISQLEICHVLDRTTPENQQRNKGHSQSMDRSLKTKNYKIASCVLIQNDALATIYQCS